MGSSWLSKPIQIPPSYRLFPPFPQFPGKCVRFFDVVKIYLFIFIYFFCLHWVFVAARGLSLAVESEGYSLAAVLGLPVAVASLVDRGFVALRHVGSS